MKEFQAIRKAALTKRDAAIKRARDEYRATLVRVSELEQDILGRDPSGFQSISASIDRVIPSDSTFTTVDIMAALEALDKPSKFVEWGFGHCGHRILLVSDRTNINLTVCTRTVRTARRTILPRRLVRVSSRQVGSGRGGGDAPALLASRLGDRS